MGGEEAGVNPNAYVPESTPKSIPLPGNRALLMLLEKASAKHKGAYRPDIVVPRPQDLEYLKNRASALLIHPAWQERNLGVKLLGLLDAKDKIPALLTLFHDRKPASLLKRLFGGDFEQVGFIRRNVISALVRMNEFSPEIEKALLAGLEDPYYEVRAEAAQAAAVFGFRLSSPDKFVSALLKLLTDDTIDVSVAAAEALGKIGRERDAFPALLGMWDSRLWKVRAAVLRGLFHLVDRGEITRLEILEAQVPRFILTSATPREESGEPEGAGRCMGGMREHGAPLPAACAESDADLARRAAGGDREAFRILVVRYQGPLLAIVANLLPRSADREDIAQEAFLAAWSHLAEYEPSRGAFFTWLAAIARNRAKNARKRRRPEPRSELPDVADPAAEVAAERAEAWRRLDAALESLPDDQRAAFTLAQIHGLPLADVARIEGVPVGTIKSRAARAREKLRAALGGEE